MGKVSVSSKVDSLKELVDSVATDAEKFDNGNNSAGTRVRKGLQEIKVLCQEIRNAVTEVKESRK